MTAKWGTCAVLAMLLAIGLVGCRTAQPDLKPTKTAEKLVDPPDRLNMAGIRKEALDPLEDPARKAMDMKSLGITPGSRAGMAGPGGMPGSPGYR